MREHFGNVGAKRLHLQSALCNGRKGFFFTMDALIAVTIISFAFLSISVVKPSAPSENIGYERMHYISEDAMQLFGMTKFSEINGTVSGEILTKTNITADYLNKSILEAIGFLWADNSTKYVENISRDFFPGIIPSGYRYAISVKDISGVKKILYSSTGAAPESGNLISLTKASRLVSGYMENTPATGFVARAWATRVKKNNTLIVMGDVISSSVKKAPPQGGTNQNNVTISYVVDIPVEADQNITDAYWFVEAAYTDNKFFAYINGEQIPGSAATGDKLFTNLGGPSCTSPCFHNGSNNALVKYWFGGNGPVGGDDGATHIVVTYNTSTTNTLFTGNKIYFQETSSDTSIRYKKPLFVTSNISSIEVHMNYTNYTGGTLIRNSTLYFMKDGRNYTISTKNITNSGALWNNTEIQTVLNANNIYYTNLSGRYFWFIVDVDQYSERENAGYQRRIFGNDSYVEINYSSAALLYNYMDITKPITNVTYSEQQWGNFYRKLNWYFNITNSSTPLDAKWQFAWLYNPGSDPTQMAQANGITLYNHTSGSAGGNPLDREFARFGYSNSPEGVLMPNSIKKNQFNLSFTSGYGVNPANSLGEYTVLIPSSVGYGSVFNTSAWAQSDAADRLMAVLGEYISAEDLEQEILTNIPLASGGVPWMYGPAIITLEVWKS